MSNDENKPIWHNPVWLTAIVGVISAFLTIPEIIGNYLTKKQDIELAKEKTESIRLGNVESKQEQEFQIVNNTLAQQGTERVFVLRYLASTLDDPEAKEWAQGEVLRLDNLASLQEAFNSTRVVFAEKEKLLLSRISRGVEDKEVLEIELSKLRTELAKKDSQISEIRKKAGLSENAPELALITVIRIEKNKKFEGKPARISIEANRRDHICEPTEDQCEFFIRGNAPKEISVFLHSYDIYAKILKTDVNLFGKLEVKVIFESSIDGIVITPNNEPSSYKKSILIDRKINYQCTTNNIVICKLEQT